MEEINKVELWVYGKDSATRLHELLKAVTDALNREGIEFDMFTSIPSGGDTNET